MRMHVLRSNIFACFQLMLHNIRMENNLQSNLKGISSALHARFTIFIILVHKSMQFSRCLRAKVAKLKSNMNTQLLYIDAFIHMPHTLL